MKKGFTLIELLVVVLIIGILSAIALPQYRVAVLKAKATQSIIQLDALWKAQIVYKLANGSYANSLEVLDISVSNVPVLNSSYANSYITDGLFFEWVWPSSSSSWPEGQKRCVANNPMAHQVCKSFGAVPINHANNTDTTTYYVLP